jgi:cytochrome P450
LIQNAKVVELDRLFREIMDAGSVFQIALDSSAFVRTLLFPMSRNCYNNIRSISAQITAMVMPIVMERKKQLKLRPVVDANTFVDALINLKGEDSLTDMEIVWNVAELMVGGTDNTSHILEWILANMVTYPAIQQKAYEEIQQAMGPNLERALVQESDLPKLPFVQAIVKESMRRHMMAVLAIPKIATQETKVRKLFPVQLGMISTSKI